jgi:hypothetical protein
LDMDEQQSLATKLGFMPRTALHVQSSVYHSGSGQLAEQVFHTLYRFFDGRALSAA